jgi:hypothetical protein
MDGIERRPASAPPLIARWLTEIPREEPKRDGRRSLLTELRDRAWASIDADRQQRMALLDAANAFRQSSGFTFPAISAVTAK